MRFDITSGAGISDEKYQSPANSCSSIKKGMETNSLGPAIRGKGFPKIE